MQLQMALWASAAAVDAAADAGAGELQVAAVEPQLSQTQAQKKPTRLEASSCKLHHFGRP